MGAERVLDGTAVPNTVLDLVPDAGSPIQPGEIPPAPASRVLDEARVFDAERKEALADSLAKVSAEQGVEIYVAAYSFLLGETIDARASCLKRAWVQSPRGVVVVYVRATEQITFAASEDFVDFLPREDLMEVFTFAAARARGFPGQELSHAERIETACTNLASAMQTRLEARATGFWKYKRQIAFFLVAFAAVLVVLTAGGWMLYRWHLRREERAAEFYYFPPVQVGARFGAHFGGGSLAEIRF
ncbi:hypothetical protein BH23VER1_BH23VER1_05630 [soil metagenome]